MVDFDQLVKFVVAQPFLVTILGGGGRRNTGRNVQHQECCGDVCGVVFHFDHGEFVGARDPALDGVAVGVQVGRRPSGVEAALHVGQERLPQRFVCFGQRTESLGDKPLCAHAVLREAVDELDVGVRRKAPVGSEPNDQRLGRQGVLVA